VSEPPIIPGQPPQQPYAPPPPQPAPTKRTPTAKIVLILAGVVIAGLLAVPAVAKFMDVITGDPAGAANSPLRQASVNCGGTGQVADGGTTLILHVIPREAGIGPVTPENLVCVLRELETPAYVTEQIGQTRALDGRQTATWGDFEASWTYHPDNGLNLVIHQR
jgi:hypothetical protein